MFFRLVRARRGYKERSRTADTPFPGGGGARRERKNGSCFQEKSPPVASAVSVSEMRWNIASLEALPR